MYELIILNNPLIVLLNLDAAENKEAFIKHLKFLEENYSKEILLINLVEEYGRESILGDAFLEQVAHYNSEKVTYVQFDFHEYWLVYY